MRILKAGLVYFLLVFGAGFALALVRIPFLVPRFGVRMAELVETPVMLLVILWASHRLARHRPPLGRPARLAAGCTAFVLLVTAELALAYVMGAQSLSQYIASRDPVSGSVYLGSLVFFAIAPALWSAGPGSDRSSKAPPPARLDSKP